MTVTINGIVTTSPGKSSAISGTFVGTITGTLTAPAVVTPPPSITWKTAPHNNWDAASQVTISGKPYYPESAEKPYDINIAQGASIDLVRFEVRNNELWSGALGGNDTERAELDGAATLYPAGTDFWFAYQFMVEPGSPQISTAGGAPGSPAAWCCLGQVHGKEGAAQVPWQLNYISDTLSVTTQRPPGQTWVNHWMDSGPTPRWKWRDVVGHLRISGTATDVCQVWIDGVKVVDYVGPIASTDLNYYFKFGIYRGWQGDGYPPLAARFANVVQGTASLLARVTAPPAMPPAVAYP